MNSRANSRAPFGGRYSEYYDLIYSDKDYDAECRYLERLIVKYGGRHRREVLELGCGTGNYTVRLARKGYQVWAVDLSAQMLKFARAKAERLGLSKRIAFMKEDMAEIRFDRSFDACVAMFAIFDYLRSERRLRQVFARIYKYLRPRGVLIFDVWNGTAVVKHRPSERVKKVQRGDTMVLRIATPKLSVSKDQCRVNYLTLVLRKGTLVANFKETHRLRYFFSTKIKAVLESCGYEVLSVHPFMRPNSRITEDDWNITLVARRPE